MADKKMVFLDIDGMRPEVLDELAADSSTSMARIARGGLRVERAVTVFPAVTLSCQASMFTGTYPATHGVVGNSWFERGVSPPVYRRYTDAKTAAGNYGFGLFGWPTIILPQRPQLQYANNDMNPEIRTVYEMMKDRGMSSWQLFNQYSRGVDKWMKPTRPEMIIFALCHEELVHNARWDRATFGHMLKEMHRADDLPDLLVFYLSGLDNNSHECGPDTQLDYFRTVVDPLMGNFLAELERRRPLEDYYFVITSDHGQAAVTREKEYIITLEMLGEILAETPGGGYRTFDKKLVRPEDTAVVCTEAGTAQVHLIDRANGDWTRPPRFEEDLLPAAQMFEKHRVGGGLGFVDVIMVRREFGADYEVFLDGELIPIEKYFDGKDGEYPDAVRRLRGINCSRSGDLVVLADYSTGKYYGDKVKAGEHGNLNSADSLIPLVITGPGVQEKTIARASLVDVVPTMGALMGFETGTAEGKSLL